jgi:hypothetical protein
VTVWQLLCSHFNPSFHAWRLWKKWLSPSYVQVFDAEIWQQCNPIEIPLNIALVIRITAFAFRADLFRNGGIALIKRRKNTYITSSELSFSLQSRTGLLYWVGWQGFAKRCLRKMWAAVAQSVLRLAKGCKTGRSESRYDKKFLFLRVVQTGTEAQASHQMGTGGSFPGGKAWRWPLTSN